MFFYFEGNKVTNNTKNTRLLFIVVLLHIEGLILHVEPNPCSETFTHTSEHPKPKPSRL